jgi:uncharacterized membrane protein YdbT with pleckstrin-like domain
MRRFSLLDYCKPNYALFIFKSTLPWLFIGVGSLFCLVSGLKFKYLGLPEIVVLPFTYALRIGCVVPLLALWYKVEWVKEYDVVIEGFRLASHSGVIFKKRESRCIGPVCFIALRQGVFDRIFGVYDLRFYAQMGMQNNSYAILPSLGEADALKLEQFFCDEMARMLGPVDVG